MIFLIPASPASSTLSAKGKNASETSIELSNTNLVGEVPIEVYRVFDKLKVLDMESNGIGGTLSEDVGRLTELKVFRV